MSSSCKDIRAELIACMLKSDCVVIGGNTVKDCFKEEHAAEVSAECMAIKKSFFECRRGMVSAAFYFMLPESEYRPGLYWAEDCLKAIVDCMVSGFFAARPEDEVSRK